MITKKSRIEKVPLTWIIIKGQVRKVFKEDDLRRLGESMLTKGQLQPIGCLKDGTLLYGERRYRAAHIVGISELEAKIFEEPLTAAEIRVVQICENLNRELLDQADLFRACMDMKMADPTLTNEGLANELHVSPSTVTRILAIGETIPAAKEAFLAGSINPAQGYAISKAEASLQPELLAAALQGESREQLEQRRKKKDPNQSAVRMERAKLPLPSGICVTVAAINQQLSLEDVAEALGQVMEGVKRAMKEALDIKTACRIFLDKSRAGQ